MSKKLATEQHSSLKQTNQDQSNQSSSSMSRTLLSPIQNYMNRNINMQQVSNGQLSYQNFKNNGGGSILRQQLNQVVSPGQMGKKNESCSLEYTTQQNTQISYFTNINHQGQHNISSTTLGGHPQIIQDKENSHQPLDLVGSGMSKECSLIQSVSPTDLTQEYDPQQQIPNHFSSPSLEALKKHLDMNAQAQQHLSRSSPHNNQLIFLSTNQSAASFKGQHSASGHQQNNFALQTGFSPRFSNFTTVGPGEDDALISPQKLDSGDRAYPQVIVDQEGLRQEDVQNFMTLGNLNSYQSMHPQSLHPGHKHTLSLGSALPEATGMKTAIFLENQTAQYTQVNSNMHSQVHSNFNSNPKPTSESANLNQNQMLLSMLDQTQRLADESEQRLRDKEREHALKMEEVKSNHQIEIERLNTEIKLLQGLKNMESTDILAASTNSNVISPTNVGMTHLTDRVRSLLIAELEAVQKSSREKESLLNGEIVILKHSKNSLEQRVKQLEEMLCSQQNNLAQTLQEKEETINFLQLELSHWKDSSSKEIGILKTQREIESKKAEQQQELKNRDILLSQQDQQVKSDAYDQLLSDFQKLQSVLNTHDHETDQQITNLNQQKELSEKFYNEKVRILENKCSSQEKLIESLKLQLSQKQEQQNTQALAKIEEREIDLKSFQDTVDSISSQVGKAMQESKSKQMSFMQQSSQLQERIGGFVKQATVKIMDQEHPNYQVLEKTLLKLQQENQLLREQLEIIHQQLVNGQSDDNQSLIRLKLGLQKLLSELREKIATFHRIESQKDEAYSILEVRLQTLEQAHSQKEAEDTETITSLTEELQSCKFSQRKWESWAKDSKERVKQMKSEVQSLRAERDAAVEALKALSEAPTSKIASEIMNKLLSQTSQSVIEVQQTSQTKLQKQTQKLQDLKEKHDELLIKHCRLINRYKSLESDQLSTWQTRQALYVEQIKSQREQISKLSDKRAQEERYNELQQSVVDSIMLEQEMLAKYQTESEVEYKRQIQVLDQQILHIEAQKHSLISIIREYEKRYTNLTEERRHQVQVLSDMNSQLKQYLEGVESGSLRDLLTSYDRMIRFIQDNAKEQLAQLVDRIVQDRRQCYSEAQEFKQVIQNDLQVILTYQQSEIDFLRQQDALKQTQLNENQNYEAYLKGQLLVQRQEYFQMRELFERQQLRLLNSQSADKFEIISSLTQKLKPHQTFSIELDKLSNELDTLKPSNLMPSEVNRIVRKLKTVMLQERLDTELVRRYALYQYNQFRNWIEEELNLVKAQREKLLLNLNGAQVLNVNHGISSPNGKQSEQAANQIIKEIRDIEKQRTSKLEVQIELLMRTLASESTEKYKDLVEQLKAYVKAKHFESSKLLAATTGIQMLNQTLPSISLRNTQILDTTYDSQQNGLAHQIPLGPLIYLQPNRDSSRSPTPTRLKTHHRPQSSLSRLNHAQSMGNLNINVQNIPQHNLSLSTSSLNMNKQDPIPNLSNDLRAASKSRGLSSARSLISQTGLKSSSSLLLNSTTKASKLLNGYSREAAGRVKQRGGAQDAQKKSGVYQSQTSLSLTRKNGGIIGALMGSGKELTTPNKSKRTGVNVNGGASFAHKKSEYLTHSISLRNEKSSTVQKEQQ